MDPRPTEQRHPQADGLHLRPAAEIGTLFVQAQGDAVNSLSAAIPAIETAAQAAAAALRRGGRLGYAGAGSSGLMASYSADGRRGATIQRRTGALSSSARQGLCMGSM